MLETLRHELKFKMSKLNAELLKKKLQCLMAYDANGANGTYHIRSLYFDDFHDTALKEKLEGVEKASKYRIRIYNGDLAQMKLERKHKKGELVDKKTISINREGYDLFIKDQRHFSDAFPELDTRLLKPKTIIGYDRTAFIYETGNVRITFDENIQSSINFTPCLYKPNSYISVQPTGSVVFEVKYTGIFPAHLRGIFNEALAGQSVSKYALGRLAGIY